MGVLSVGFVLEFVNWGGGGVGSQDAPLRRPFPVSFAGVGVLLLGVRSRPDARHYAS